MGHFPKLFLCSGHVFIFFFNHLETAPALLHVIWWSYQLQSTFLVTGVTGYPKRYPIPLETKINKRADKTWAEPETFEGSEAERERAAVLSSWVSCCKDDLILKTPAVILRAPKQCLEVKSEKLAESKDEKRGRVLVTLWSCWIQLCLKVV